MKKVILYFLVFILCVLVCVFGYSKDIKIGPKYYYQVYLDGDVLGVIKDKDELEQYIDNQGSEIKKEFNVEKVYAPNGLQVKRIITYDEELNSVEEVYDKLTYLKPFTIQGYQFTITREEESTGSKIKNIVYVTDKDLFKEAVENTLRAYVGIDEYNAYKDNTQEEIKTTGLYIDDVYLADDVLVRSYKIPVTEQIFSDVNELSKYILYGTTKEGETYKIKSGDTLESIAEKNSMNVEALLISNKNLTSSNNLLYNGQEISIARPDPLVQVMARYTSVEDKESRYSIEEKYDSNMNIGDEYVVQNGKNGIDRVTSSILKINGTLLESTTNSSSVIEPAVNQIVMVGSRRVSNIGSLQWWKWPAIGYVTSGYDYRNIGFGWEFHQGIDISGGGNGSPIYAANNGTVIEAYGTYPYNMTPLSSSGYGNYIIINHNNGYWTLYAHMSGLARGLKAGSTVERGQVIGYMGETGMAFGAHLHFELWKIVPWSAGKYSSGIPVGNLNPLSVVYR